MYVGHVVAALFLHSYDSSVSSFLLKFSAVFTDITMAILALMCIEVFELNSKAVGYRTDLDVQISHSLSSALVQLLHSVIYLSMIPISHRNHQVFFTT